MSDKKVILKLGQIIKYKEDNCELKIAIIKENFPYTGHVRGRVIKTNYHGWSVGEELNFTYSKKTMTVIEDLKIKNLTTKTPKGKKITCLISRKN